MERRTLLTASIAVIGSTVTGCLENRRLMGDSDDSGGATDSTDTDTNDPEDNDGTETNGTENGNESNDRTETDSNCPNDHETDEQSTICETKFEVLNRSGNQESASVTFNDESVIATGAIQGNNGCYTARLSDVRIEGERLVVSIESYEDADEDTDCTMAIIFIEYEATVKIHGTRPQSVHVEHNGEQMTTKQSS